MATETLTQSYLWIKITQHTLFEGPKEKTNDQPLSAPFPLLNTFRPPPNFFPF